MNLSKAYTIQVNSDHLSCEYLIFIYFSISLYFYLELFKFQGACMVQSLNHPTLNPGSGHDLMVCETEPCNGLCVDSLEPAWDFFPPPLSLPLPHSLMCALSLSLSLSKLVNIKKEHCLNFSGHLLIITLLL